MITILIIEDEKDIVEYITEFAEEEGHRVVSTDDSKVAISKCKNQRFDLILLDLHLTNGSGEDVVEKVRYPTSLNCRTPIVVISGHIEEKVLLKMAKKVNGAIVKPFGVERILEVFNKYSAAA